MKHFEKLNETLVVKLKEPMFDFAVLDTMGQFLFERFRNNNQKTEKRAFLQKVLRILKISLQTLDTQAPEHILIKGKEAFLILIPSLSREYFYMVFCDNGMNSGMVRICVQDAVQNFEAKD